jgi:Transposase IS116/IS110/IS902 family/WD domain, G-beta repeat
MISLCRSLLRQEGIRVPSGGAPSFPQRVRAFALSEDLAAVVEPLLKTHEQTCAQLELLDDHVKQAVNTDERQKRLTTVPSVGPVAAATFVALVDDAERFASSARLCSYLGLVPRDYSSGEKQQRGHITKAESSRLRSLPSVRSLAVSSGLYVGALAFSPDGALVATGGDVGPVEVWRSSDGVRVLAIDIPGSVHAVRFAPSGTQLVVSSVLGRASVWNLADGSQARELEDSVHGRSAASPSPDSAWLAISGNGGELQVWDFRTGVRTQTLTGHAGGSMGYLEWIGPDLLLSNDWDGTVRSWPRGAQGTLVPGGVWELSDPGLPQQLYGLAVAPGGARFAAGGVRGGVAGFSFGAL